MQFQKNNQVGAKKTFKDELHDKSIYFKDRLGQKEKLKAVSNWQERQARICL
ncbi:hypothetical protein [Nostoc sp. ATCC 53789]|uniref:hypothetical protein n=1 Tax=Nostoc sp. ATCC 53789 TaxID=76335 RepID=UPI001C68D072|nr:hypothetical protein [Nostoc sp. ATCC 53789]